MGTLVQSPQLYQCNLCISKICLLLFASTALELMWQDHYLLCLLVLPVVFYASHLTDELNIVTQIIKLIWLIILIYHT